MNELKNLTNERLDELHSLLSKANDILNPEGLTISALCRSDKEMAYIVSLSSIKVFNELARRGK